MRRAAATVGRERGGNFGKAHAHLGRLDDHLGGELHAGSLEIHAQEGVFREAADAAVEVAERGAEEQLADAGEDRVADVAILPGHGAGLDLAGEAIAHDEVIAVAEFGDKGAEIGEVVAVVGVAHDEVAATGGGAGGVEGRAVATDGNVNDAGTVCECDRLRAVGRPVVAEDDLAGDARGREEALRFSEAERERLGFVEAGHDDGQFHAVSLHAVCEPTLPAVECPGTTLLTAHRTRRQSNIATRVKTGASRAAGWSCVFA